MGFEDHPDRYVLHLVSACPESSHFEDVNIIFVIFANYKHKPMPYSVCRRLPRFAQATEYLRTHGITEVDELKLMRNVHVSFMYNFSTVDHTRTWHHFQCPLSFFVQSISCSTIYAVIYTCTRFSARQTDSVEVQAGTTPGITGLRLECREASGWHRRPPTNCPHTSITLFPLLRAKAMTLCFVVQLTRQLQVSSQR